MQDSVEYLAYKLFFTMLCYRDDQKYKNNAFSVIPVFENEQEHTEFIEYIKTHKDDFKKDVDAQSVEEMFPFYAQTVDTVNVYKLGKTLVRWLDKWRGFCSDEQNYEK